MECSGAAGEEGEVEMLFQCQTAQVPSRRQDAMVLEYNTTLPLEGAWRQPEIVHNTNQDQTAEIDTGLNKVQLKTAAFNKSVCCAKEAAFRVPGKPPAVWQ